MLRRVLMLLSVLVGACVSTSAPPDDAGFAPVTGLPQLVGCYRNLGEAAQGVSPRYLSQLLWPDSEVEPRQVETIRVEQAGPNALDVSGEAPGSDGRRVLRASRFTRGEDFDLEAGGITIRNKSFGSLAGPADNPFIGAGRESVTLGLDPHGNARLAETTTFAGTAFLVIPAVGRVSSSVRFVRIPCDD